MNASIYSTNGKMAYQMDGEIGTLLFDRADAVRVLVQPGKPNRMEHRIDGKWISTGAVNTKKLIAKVEAAIK